MPRQPKPTGHAVREENRSYLHLVNLHTPVPDGVSSAATVRIEAQVGGSGGDNHRGCFENTLCYDIVVEAGTWHVARGT